MNEQAIIRTLQGAYGALQKGDAAGAGRMLGPLASQYPNRPDVLHLHALVLRGGGNLAGARQALARAVEVSGGSAEIRNSLGNVLMEMGELASAEEQFAAATATQPAYLAGWVNRGRVASRKGQHEQAVGFLERACAIDPKSVLARTSLGEAHRAARNFDKAVEVLKEAVALNPQGSVRLQLGLALRAAERQPEAIAEYDAAERAGHCAPELLDNRGAAWLDLGDVERAKADYDALVARFPGYLGGHRARARLYWDWGLEGDPFESYRRTAEAYPREAAVWSEWLSTLLSFRQFETALDVAERAGKAIGDGPLTKGAKAVALSEVGRLAEAGATFEACMAKFADQPLFLNSYVRHLIRAKDPQRAIALAEHSIARDPDNQVAWAYLGTAWRMLGDPRERWLHDYQHHVTQVDARPPGFDGSAEDFAMAVAPTLRALHLAKVHPADQTLRNGTQTPGALFDRREPEIRQIRQAVEAAALAFMEALPDDPAHPLLRRKGQAVAFTGSWSVRLMQHGFHINHVHERGWLSSAYYFALPPPDPADAGQAGWLQLGAPPEELGLAMEPRRIIEPKVGTLVLFPSSMWHGTVPFAASGERLTAAFDIVPVRGA